MDIIAFLTPYPAWIKIALAIGVLCVFAAVVGMVFTPVPKSTAQQPAGTSAVNITSNNQKGGVTAHTVNVDKPK